MEPCCSSNICKRRFEMKRIFNQRQYQVLDFRNLKPGGLFFKSLFYALLIFVLLPSLSVGAQPAQQTTNLALNKPAACSPTPQFPCAEAFDGSLTTRWASVQGVDPQWIYVDLGASYNISHVKLTWETAYGKSYQIQASPDAATWTSIYTTTTGDGGIDDLTGLSGSGRYIRMNGTVRGTGWGYSLWEFEVYAGSGGPTVTVTPTNTNGPSATPTRTSTAGPSATPTHTATTGPTLTRTNTPPPGNTNMAAWENAVSSANENPSLGPNLVTDTSLTTRWSSPASDPQWIYVDLGAAASITRVVLRWETAYGKSYQIQTSSDAATWTPIYTTTTGDGGVDDLTGLTGSGRYVRMYGTVRGTQYGYSLWEFEVYAGTGGPTNTPTWTATAPAITNTPTITATSPTGVCSQPANPNFGPNMRIFDTSMSAATIQAQLDADFNMMKDTQTAQFSENRVAHLFKPGTYAVFDNVGFYTSVAGLGINPTDVTINGAVTVDAFNASDAGNATQNFWRSAENMSINTNGGADRWAVAQAAPFRRMNIIGGTHRFPARLRRASRGSKFHNQRTGPAGFAPPQA